MSNNISDILNKFDKCSLSEMDSVKLMNRVDTKYILNKTDFLEVFKLLHKDYFCLEIKGNSLLSYKNQYFDDSIFGCFHDHHRKKTNRFKIRIRKYVESDICFLEVKKKKKGRTDKERILVDGFVDKLDEKKLNYIQGKVNKEIRFSPTLWNDFQRITLVSKTEAERLTLDFNLSFEFEGKKKTYPNIIIAELKQGKANRTSVFFKELKNRLIRPYRISKYCIGTMDLYSNKKIKSNRFKKKYLYINKLNKAC